MPQEPPPLDLDELTRLYERERNVWPSFVRDRIMQAFPALRDELERLRPQEAAATEACHIANERQDTIWALERQLDEAKGLLELLVQEDGLLSHHEPRSSSLGSIARDARAFLASLAGREGGHSGELKDAQEDANQFGSDWGQLTKALGAHGEESCPITGKDTHEDIHERAMQRIRDLVAEEGEAGDLREQLETAKMWIATSANRFETIRETHPSISLDHDISNLRGFLTGKEIKSSFRVLNEGSTEDHPTGILTIPCPEQPTQGEVKS